MRYFKNYFSIIVFFSSINLVAASSFKDAEFFWPLDLKAEVNFDHSTFEDEAPCLSVSKARKELSKKANDPHSYVELMRALKNEYVIEDFRPYNKQVIELYKAKSERTKLAGKEYVEWGKAASNLDGPISALPILEKGIASFASGKDRLEVSRSLGMNYFLSASMTLMPPGMFDIVKDADGADDFFESFYSVAQKHKGGISAHQKSVAGEYLKKSEKVFAEAIKDPKAKAIDYFNYAWFEFTGGLLKDAIYDRPDGTDGLALFTSPYLDKAFTMEKGNPKVEAAKSLRNFMVMLVNIENGKASREDVLRVISAEKTKLEKLSQKRSAPAEVYDALAFVSYVLQEGDYRVQNLCIKALAKNPSLKNAFVIRVLYLFKEENWKEILSLAKRKYKKDKLAVSYKIAACAAAYNNDFEKAGELASDGIFISSDATNNNSDKDDLSIILATAKIKNGQVDEGIKTLKILRRFGVRHPVLYYNLALALFKTGAYSDSKHLLKQLKSLESNQVYSTQMRAAARQLELMLYNY